MPADGISPTKLAHGVYVTNGPSPRRLVWSSGSFYYQAVRVSWVGVRAGSTGRSSSRRPLGDVCGGSIKRTCRPSGTSRFDTVGGARRTSRGVAPGRFSPTGLGGTVGLNVCIGSRTSIPTPSDVGRRLPSSEAMHDHVEGSTDDHDDGSSPPHRTAPTCTTPSGRLLNELIRPPTNRPHQTDAKTRGFFTTTTNDCAWCRTCLRRQCLAPRSVRFVLQTHHDSGRPRIVLYGGYGL